MIQRSLRFSLDPGTADIYNDASIVGYDPFHLLGKGQEPINVLPGMDIAVFLLTFEGKWRGRHYQVHSSLRNALHQFQGVAQICCTELCLIVRSLDKPLN